MDLIVYQMVQLQVMHVSDCYRAVKILSGTAVTKPYLSVPADGHALPEFSVISVQRQVLEYFRTQLIFMLCFKFFPFQVHVIVCQVKGIHNIIFIGAVKYRCCHVKAQGLGCQGQMDFQYLSDIHTGRHAQRIQYDIKRASVGQVRHILHGKHTGNNTLVAVTACHLVTYGNLSLLCDVNTHCLIHTGRKLIAIFPRKYLGIHNDAVFTVRHLQGRIPYFSCLLTENGTQKPFFSRQFGFSLGSYLTHKDIACTDLCTDADNSSVVQILQGFITNAGNVSCDFFRPQLCVSGFRFVFFNMDGGIYILLYQSLT